MSELLKQLAAYGVNVPETMDRFVNDTELYAKCLTLLIQDDNWQLLGDALQSGDLDQAFMAPTRSRGLRATWG